ncbi:MAG: hypothetical protein ABDH16_08330, partial [Thermodesulfovibrionaceae bacterium]
AKLKGMAKKYKEEILNKERLRRINEEIWIGEKEIEGKRVIIGWSQSRKGPSNEGGDIGEIKGKTY